MDNIFGPLVIRTASDYFINTIIVTVDPIRKNFNQEWSSRPLKFGNHNDFNRKRSTNPIYSIA